jgi:phage terminase large subunit
VNTALDAYIQAARAAGCPADQIANFIRAGVVLQPRQLVASAAARQCDTPGGPVEIAYGGARGGGKSHWGMAQVGADDCQRFPGLKVLVLRKVGKALKEGVGDLLRRIYTGIAYQWVASTQTVAFPNGSRLVLGHFQKESDIDTYLGLEYDLILVEEATTLSASKRRNILTCLRTSKDGWRPRIYYTTNPGGIGHAWFKRELVDPHRYAGAYRPLAAQRGRTRYVPATVDDNTFVDPDYRGTLDTLTGWQLRAWRHGDWDIAAGQYFTTFRRDVHVQPTLHTLPATWPLYLGMDYGYTHWTVSHLVTVADGTVIFLDEYADRRKLISHNARGILAMLARWNRKPHHLRAAVAGTDIFAQRHTGTTIAADYQEQGLTFTPAITDRINGAATFLRRLGDVDAQPAIAPTLIIGERCGMLIECLPQLQHDPHNPEDVLKVDCDDDGLDGDDPYDSGRYVLMAATRPSPGPAAAGGSRAGVVAR